MTIVIDKLFYDSEGVLILFHDDTEAKNRTVFLSWDTIISLNTLINITTAINNIRLKQIFIESINGTRMQKTQIIDNTNYDI